MVKTKQAEMQKSEAVDVEARLGNLYRFQYERVARGLEVEKKMLHPWSEVREDLRFLYDILGLLYEVQGEGDTSRSMVEGELSFQRAERNGTEVLEGDGESASDGLVQRIKQRLFFGIRKLGDGPRATKKEVLQALGLALEEVGSTSSVSFPLDKKEVVDEEVVCRVVDYFLRGLREQVYERHLSKEEALQVLEGLMRQVPACPPSSFGGPV